MFTILIIIIIVVVVVKASNKPDKKSKKQQTKDEQRVAELPNMEFVAQEMTSSQRALNLWPGDKDLLEIFRYNGDNSNLYLKMKDGRSVDCPLSQLEVWFDKVSGIYRIVIKHNNTSFSFYKYAYVFKDKEWEVILDTLTLAGTTHNVAIMGTAYKNLTKVNTALKIIKALS